MPRRIRIRRIVRIPREYLDAMEMGNILFPSLYQLENGLRLVIHNHLSLCYGTSWWEYSLKNNLPDIYNYSQEQQNKRNAMPWIGDSTKIKVLPIHLVTLGHLEEIIKKYQSDCIPQIFPNLIFFLGHMDTIKRVRNLYAHMFPCITPEDCSLARREITTLAKHINSKL